MQILCSLGILCHRPVSISTWRPWVLALSNHIMSAVTSSARASFQISVPQMDNIALVFTLLRGIASFPPPCRCFLRSPLDVTRPLDIIREELPEVHDFVNSCLVELLANESRLSLELTLQGVKNFEKHPMFFELPSSCSINNVTS